MPGRSMSDLDRNSEGVMGKITSAKSDPPEQCKASPRPRT
jgi:hypothetical protein